MYPRNLFVTLVLSVPLFFLFFFLFTLHTIECTHATRYCSTDTSIVEYSTVLNLNYTCTCGTSTTGTATAAAAIESTDTAVG